MNPSSANPTGELQGLLVLVASLSHGLENVLGRGAPPITFRAGRTIGLKAKVSKTTTDPIEALTLVRQELDATGIHWPFEIWNPSGQSDPVYTNANGKRALKLVFRHCMVRCALFRYSHEQKQSLCMMNHGLFCGYLQNILGKKADLDILHAGESACLKELVIHD
jgi:predicted hydrocarbon binding protein